MKHAKPLQFSKHPAYLPMPDFFIKEDCTYEIAFQKIAQ